MTTIKVTVLGKGITGKSSMIFRFLGKDRNDDYVPTIETKYQKQQTISGICTTIEILDTAGKDEYQNLFDIWVNFADGVLLTYAIDDRKSFEAVKESYRKIKRKWKNCEIVLAGNRVDLESKRKVTTKEGKELAESWGCSFFETSGVNNINCKEAFEGLAECIINKLKEEKKINNKAIGNVNVNSRRCCCVII